MLNKPYCGLMPYSEADAPYFFGRERSRKIITDNLMAFRLTLLFGSSGVGKSSVLQAGVAHHLREFAAQNLQEYDAPKFAIVVFSAWRTDPLSSLKQRIETDIKAIPGIEKVRSLAVPSPSLSLVETLRAWTTALGTDEEIGELFIILDQFEEYFLYHPKEKGEGTFTTEFSQAVNCPDLPVNFLIAMREDSVAKLDHFKRTIPDIFANNLRIFHLDKASARIAIVKPVEKYLEEHGCELGFDPNSVDLSHLKLVDPGLIDAVLEQVQVNQIAMSENGKGGKERAEFEDRVEAPYLQLVMTRLWEEEVGEHPETLCVERIQSGSYLLRLETLNNLAGAKQIVKEFLMKKMEMLEPEQQEAAATIFQYLVTPEGRKIAYPALQLVEFTKLDQEHLQLLLKALDDQRILRSVRLAGDQTDEGYELFHDVLAAAVLDWRRKYLETQKLEAAQRDQQQKLEAERQRRVQIIKRGLAMSALRYHRRGQNELAALLALQAYRFNQQESCHMLDPVDEALRAILTDKYFCNILQWSVSEESYAISAVAFSSQKQLDSSELHSTWIAAASFGGPIRLWRLNQPSERRTLDCQGTKVYSISFSPKGEWLAAGCSDSMIRLWNLRETDPLPRLLKGHQERVRSIAFSPIGCLLASGSDDTTIRLWNLDSPSFESQVLTGHQGGVRSIAFSSDANLLASGSEDKTIKIWAVQELDVKPITRYGHEGTVRSLAFSLNRKILASGSADSTVRLWDIQQINAVPKVLQGHQGGVNSVAFHPDGLLASAGADQSIRLWKVEKSDQPVDVLWGHYSTINSIAFSSDGQKLLSGSKDNMVRLWDLAEPSALPKQLKHHENVIRAIAFSPDGRLLASASEDRTVLLWDLSQPTAEPQRKKHPDQVFAVMFFQRNQQVWIATGCADYKVRLWNLHQPKADPIELDGHTKGISSLAFSPQGAILASGSWDKTIRLWYLDSIDEIKSVLLPGHTASVTAVAFSPDGKFLASGSDDCTIRLWSLEDLTAPPKILKDHNGRVWSVAFSPVENILASGSDDWTVRLWDLSQPQPTHTILGRHNTWVSSVVFSRDGKTLASGSYDRSIKLWNLEHRNELPIVLVNHNQSVTSLAFSPDGQFLASGSYDRTIRLWIAKTETLADLVRQKLVRNFSQEEWEQLIGNEIDYECTCSDLPAGDGV